MLINKKNSNYITNMNKTNICQKKSFANNHSYFYKLTSLQYHYLPGYNNLILHKNLKFN